MARWRFRPPVERTRHGFRLHLEPVERELVGRMLREYREVLQGPADHPALRRLFPPAYASGDEHADHEAEYQRLMRDELVASRLAGIDIVLEVLADDPDATLDEGRLLAFVQALNGVRLALAVLAGLDRDDDPDDDPGDDPDDEFDDDEPGDDEPDDDEPDDGPDQQLYGYLSYLLEWSIQALDGS